MTTNEMIEIELIEEGFSRAGRELIKAFDGKKPDFILAEGLINNGADINEKVDDDSNILSTVIENYCEAAYRNPSCENCNLEAEECLCCVHSLEHYKDNERGKTLCKIIQFFLDHGFDVKKDDDCYGAQCLFSLVLSTFDSYMVKAVKLLFDAGAVNRTVTVELEDEGDTPWDFFSTEESAQEVVYKDYRLANIYEGVYQLFQAQEDNRPYSGIDTFEAAIGKRIEHIFADSDDLFIAFEGGCLMAPKNNNLWTDTVLPDKKLDDVSEQYADLIGEKIKDFAFDIKQYDEGRKIYLIEILLETDKKLSLVQWC